MTSISADIHKYGYASKGASVLVWRNEMLRSFQYFAYSNWPGGLFCSPSMSGSRPGGVIAAAWAAMVAMASYVAYILNLPLANRRISRNLKVTNHEHYNHHCNLGTRRVHRNGQTDICNYM